MKGFKMIFILASAGSNETVGGPNFVDVFVARGDIEEEREAEGAEEAE